jgi:hypothetical protein
MRGMEKKINLGDVTIEIRILRALVDIKPFGVFWNFYMVKILRNLKQPNLITAANIWEFIDAECAAQRFHEAADAGIEKEVCPYEQTFDE